jgi:hypothetical protein
MDLLLARRRLSSNLEKWVLWEMRFCFVGGKESAVRQTGKELMRNESTSQSALVCFYASRRKCHSAFTLEVAPLQIM